ncbi:MAG: DUF2867 domain-containing protein [Nocardioides sp.]
MSSAPHSAAPSLVDRVDHVDAFAVALPAGAPTDPAAWVDEIFSIDDLPEWVGRLFTLRSALVPLLGLPAKPAENPFRVREVRDGEALVLAKDRHLDFRVRAPLRTGAHGRNDRRTPTRVAGQGLLVAGLSIPRTGAGCDDAARGGAGRIVRAPVGNRLGRRPNPRSPRQGHGRAR